MTRERERESLFALLTQVGIEEASKKIESLSETIKSKSSLLNEKEALKLLKIENWRKHKINGGIRMFRCPANPEFRQCFKGHIISVKRRRRNRKT